MESSLFLLELVELGKRSALILGLAWLGVIAAMSIDLVSGVRKAQRAGIARTSYGYRRTIDKLNRYGTALIFALIADAIMIVGQVYSSPYASIILSGAIVLIEAKSWFEKLEDKDRTSMTESLHTIAKAVTQRNPEAIIQDLKTTNAQDHDATLHPQGADQEPDGRAAQPTQRTRRRRKARPVQPVSEHPRTP